MPIDELSKYWPKIKLPLYTKITDPRFNDFTVGEEYDIRIEDPDRVEEKDGSGPYNYIHECILIAKEKLTISELPGLVLAFDAHSRNKNKALKRISPDNEKWDNDKEIVLLIFLRKDAVKEYVTSDIEVLEDKDITEEFNKEDAENNE